MLRSRDYRAIWISFTALFCMIGLSAALYSPTDDVIELTGNNFDSEVLQSNGIWLVEFYAPWCGYCKSLAPVWKKAAAALKGIVNVAGVDMTAHRSVGQPYDIKGFPTIKIFGADKQKPRKYKGPRTTKGIIEAAFSHVRKMVKKRLSDILSVDESLDEGVSGNQNGDVQPIIELTDSNFEKLVYGGTDIWIVNFFIPECQLCRNLKPHWITAATELADKVKVGEMDTTKHSATAERFEFQGYPTIKMFPTGRKHQIAVLDYKGASTAEDIVAWVFENLKEDESTTESLSRDDQNKADLEEV